VSNQNQEEAEHELGNEQAEPGTGHQDESKQRGAQQKDGSPGSSTEGSQATGHPENAG
jgi:hypothetical protein